MQSPVYVLFIDASKAFDRLCHIELFNILSERNMCPLVRRLWGIRLLYSLEFVT